MSRGGNLMRSTGERRALRAAAAATALVLLATVPYLGALHHPLLHDDRTLLDNPWLRQAGLVEIFGSDYWRGTRHEGSDLYRPVTLTTLAWNVRSARSAAAFRWISLALHAGVVLLVWRVLEVVWHGLGSDVDSAAGSDRARETSPFTPGWIGAALFAAHPLVSESVLFAVGRAELLAAGFGLLAFGLVIDAEGRGAWRVAVSSALFGLAFLSKESAVAWIVILAVWSLNVRAAGRGPGRAATALAAWAGLLAPLLIARASVVGWWPRRPPWVDNPLVLEGIFGRGVNAIRIHAIYLGKMVFPARLSVDHGFDQIGVWPVLPWGLLVASIILAAWIAIAAALRRRSPAAVFLWAFVPAAFALTGNVVIPIGTIFAERLAYLPLVGLCGLGGYVIVRVARTRGAIVVILVLALSPAVLRTARRTEDLRDHGTFVEATAAASPRAVKALVNVGRSRMRSGRVVEALEPLERAVTLWPDYRRALGLLAEAWSRLGDEETAARYREREKAAAERAKTAGGPPPP